MFFRKKQKKEELAPHAVHSDDIVASIRKSMAVIEFDLKGNIVDANDAFLSAMGYTLDEVKGKHHRIFCSEKDVASPRYQKHWQELANGIQKSGTFCRYKKDGSQIFIEATYFPIFKGSDVIGIMKIASDILF